MAEEFEKSVPEKINDLDKRIKYLKEEIMRRDNVEFWADEDTTDNLRKQLELLEAERNKLLH